MSNILRYAVRTLKWLPANPVDDGLIFGTFVRMSICTGARRGEICALQWKHIDFERGRVAVQASIALGADGYYRKAPKNGRGRTIALPRP